MATATNYISRAVAPSVKRTPQTRKIKGTNQKPNNGGGFSFVVDDWTRFNRWLILGSEGGSYYVGEKKLTKQNVKALFRCIEADGIRTVDEIVAVSVGGR